MPKRTKPSTKDYGAGNKKGGTGWQAGGITDKQRRKASWKRDGGYEDGRESKRNKAGRRHGKADPVPSHRDIRDGIITWNE